MCTGLRALRAAAAVEEEGLVHVPVVANLEAELQTAARVVKAKRFGPLWREVVVPDGRLTNQLTSRADLVSKDPQLRIARAIGLLLQGMDVVSAPSTEADARRRCSRRLRWWRWRGCSADANVLGLHEDEAH
eukprot:4328775-Prymnesium_polylepis.1